jgi:hypothetical protein
MARAADAAGRQVQAQSQDPHDEPTVPSRYAS